MMSATSTNSDSLNYNPAFCLQEHLEYFDASVAGQLNADFDEIFGGLIAEMEESTLPSLPPMQQQMPLQTAAPVQSSATGFEALKPRPVSPSSSPSKSYSATVQAPTVPSSRVTPPASPKYNYAPVCPNPFLNMDRNMAREQAVVSPTTVALVEATLSVTPVLSSAVAPAAKKSRKRQVSDVTADTASAASAAVVAPRRKSAKKIDPNDKEDVRRERNRQHAKRSRQRKREFLNALEQSVLELKAENEQLFSIMGLASEEGRQQVLQRQTELADVANEGFIAALSQPQNRVLSDDALASLRELF